MWNWNKAIAALVTGLLVPGLQGENPWISNLWQMDAVIVAAIIAVATWAVPNGRPVWEVWKDSK